MKLNINSKELAKRLIRGVSRDILEGDKITEKRIRETTHKALVTCPVCSGQMIGIEHHHAEPIQKETIYLEKPSAEEKLTTTQEPKEIIKERIIEKHYYMLPGEKIPTELIQKTSQQVEEIKKTLVENETEGVTETQEVTTDEDVTRAEDVEIAEDALSQEREQPITPEPVIQGITAKQPEELKKEVYELPVELDHLFEPMELSKPIAPPVPPTLTLDELEETPILRTLDEAEQELEKEVGAIDFDDIPTILEEMGAQEVNVPKITKEGKEAAEKIEIIHLDEPSKPVEPRKVITKDGIKKLGLKEIKPSEKQKYKPQKNEKKISPGFRQIVVSKGPITVIQGTHEGPPTEIIAPKGKIQVRAGEIAVPREALVAMQRGLEYKDPILKRVPEITHRIPKNLLRTMGSDWKPIDLLSVNERYALIDPYAYANVRWNPEEGALKYYLIEPPLTEKQKKKLAKIKDLIVDFLNINLFEIKDYDSTRKYLSKKIDELVANYNIRVARDEYDIINYYIARDLLGLGKIEPMMRDETIEDISCIGVNTPLYIFHRKYGSIKTNLIYNDATKLNAFLVSLAQKVGKDVSVAEPLLRGSLPDGSRVSATYSSGSDIATKGSTYTIRKFSKDPFTIIDLINFGTITPMMAAYLWLALEHNNSLLIAGGTATGKCVAPDQEVILSDGNIKPIKEIFESNTKNTQFSGKDEMHPTIREVKLPSMNPENLNVEDINVSAHWRMKTRKQMYEVTAQNGAKIVVTPEHPFFVLNQGIIEKTPASTLIKGDLIAVPREIKIKGKLQEIDKFNVFKDYFYTGPIVKQLIQKLLERHKTLTEISTVLKLDYNTIKLAREKDTAKLEVLERMIYDTGQDAKKISDKITFIHAKTSNKQVKIPKYLTAELLELIGYVQADGTIDRNTVLFFNNDITLRKRFSYLINKLFWLKTKTTVKNTVKTELVSSSVVTALLVNLGIPKGKKSSKIKVLEIVLKSRTKDINHYLRAIFDSESHIQNKQRTIELTTASENWSKRIPVLLLRNGIMSSVKEKYVNSKKFYRIYIQGKENLKNYEKYIGFNHPQKKRTLRYKIAEGGKEDANTELLPISDIAWSLKRKVSTQKELANLLGVSRRAIGFYLSGERAPTRYTVKKFVKRLKAKEFEKERNKLDHLANSNTTWVKVKDINRIKSYSKEVYDFTVPGHHNFLAGTLPIIVSNTTILNAISMFLPPESKIVSIEDTPEIRLAHENWVPKVARSGTGAMDVTGRRMGEITMFDLLKIAFRERPEHVIVGEVRGEEAYVLFQMMASGHPGMSTMHADSIETLIHRLTTKPIDLSAGLLTTLDIVMIMQHAKVKGREVRRLKALEEVIGIDPNTQRPISNTLFEWDPATDTFSFKSDKSYILDEIIKLKGISEASLWAELQRRTQVIKWMKKTNTRYYRDVAKVIRMYYKDPEKLLSKIEL